MSQAQPIDTLLNACWCIPMTEGSTYTEQTSVAIDQGKIVAVLPTNQAQAQFAPQEQMDLKDHVILPGFVNTHMHTSMCLMRGIADDLPLKQWLEDYIWPAEAACFSSEFVKEGLELALVEMIRGGSTCMSDMYFLGYEQAPIVHAAGLRGRVSDSILKFPSAFTPSVEVCFERTIKTLEAVKAFPLVGAALSPHSPYATNEDILLRVKALSEEYDVPIQMHVQETHGEVRQHMALYNERPIQTLARLGLLTDKMMLVHMTQVSLIDLEFLTQHDSSVIHCPESNMKLASGASSVTRLMKAGVNVALGTDGAASNNNLDMIGEMRSAALMAKLVEEDPEALSAHDVLKMATINGAKAMGYADKIGSLEEGKSADIIAVDLSHASTQPVFNPISQLVYAANSQQVSDVWVEGKRLLKSGQLMTLNEEAILSKAKIWHDKVKGAARH